MLALYPGMTGMKGECLHRREEPEFLHHRRTRDNPKTGASGVILAQGGAHSGWSLYLKDEPKFAYNFLGKVTTIASNERLPAGPVTLTYEFAYCGAGKFGAGGTDALDKGQKDRPPGKIERTIPFIYGTETADVGVDLYTPVTADTQNRTTTSLPERLRTATVAVT